MLYKTSRLIGQVLVVVFLLAVLGAQVVSAQTTLPPCTESLSGLPEYQEDDDGVDQDVDVDKDGDGLIEICDLEGLNEMRYALDGAGYTTSTMAIPNSMGCSSTCTGFELTRNLSFTDNDSYRMPANRVEYTDGNGWEPIGTLGSRFNTKFEGNGHTISNLRINRSTSDIGLFGFTDVMADIANIGLPNVRIIGRTQTGGLVGTSIGSITNSYATGSVSGDSWVGGLVGQGGDSITNSHAAVFVKGRNQAGGLAGQSSGSITNSYATGSVEGTDNVGGLIGFNTGSSITNSYATGSVEGTDNVGGLIGFNTGSSITNSYATGSVEGTDNVGGLVGQSSGSITNSYATGSVEGTENVDGLVGQSSGSITNSSATTIVQLQTPTTTTGIYENWDVNVWDFGTENDRPTLRNNPEIELIRIRTKVFLEGPLQ